MGIKYSFYVIALGSSLSLSVWADTVSTDDISCETSDDTVVCELPNDDQLERVDLVTVLEAANKVETSIDENTVFWLQAWGGEGKQGYDCIGATSGTHDGSSDHGDGGSEGYAQFISTINEFYNNYGTTVLYYYIGNEGNRYRLVNVTTGYCISYSSGTGGAATLVATTDNELTSLSDIVAIAGGGGGGGLGNSCSGTDGGDGGIAISSTTAMASAAGEDGDDKSAKSIYGGKGGNADGEGSGGAGADTEGQNFDGLTDGQDGIGGNSGQITSDGGDAAAAGWLNASPNLDGSAGQGGEDTFDYSGHTGGTGGGGYGGGGTGEYHNGSGHKKCATGGGGGGSYAAQSHVASSNAPTDKPSRSTDYGAVKIVFDYSTSSETNI